MVAPETRPDGWAIEAICVGRVAPLGARGVPSGIDKQPIAQPLPLTKAGFVGDEQGDLRHHGGPDKAVHHYPIDHRVAWEEEIGTNALLTGAAAFGENLAVRGLTEADVAIGDRFALGTAVIEVSQGRQPCFKLNLRFDVPDMALRMQRNGRTGWYYRVVESGLVAPEDRLRLLDRPSPLWTIARLHRTFYLDPMDRPSLRTIASLPQLAERWRQLAQKRLDSGQVEDWSARLRGDR